MTEKTAQSVANLGYHAHIYIGTIGMEGAFEAMGTGTVDINWARQHHALWLEEQSGPAAADPAQAQPSATPGE